MSKATELVSARRFHAQALSYAREQAPERAGAAEAWAHWVEGWDQTGERDPGELEELYTGLISSAALEGDLTLEDARAVRSGELGDAPIVAAICEDECGRAAWCRDIGPVADMENGPSPNDWLDAQGPGYQCGACWLRMMREADEEHEPQVLSAAQARAMFEASDNAAAAREIRAERRATPGAVGTEFVEGIAERSAGTPGSHIGDWAQRAGVLLSGMNLDVAALRRDGRMLTLVAWPEQGGWFEEGHDPTSEETGYLFAPMQTDGSFVPEEIAEVSVPWSEAGGQGGPSADLDEVEPSRFEAECEIVDRLAAEWGFSGPDPAGCWWFEVRPDCSYALLDTDGEGIRAGLYSSDEREGPAEWQAPGAKPVVWWPGSEGEYMIVCPLDGAKQADATERWLRGLLEILTGLDPARRKAAQAAEEAR